MTNNLRIAWLSPYGSRSDIGAFTRCLLPHFAKEDPRSFDCDLYVNPCGPSYDSPVPMTDIPAGGAIGEILARYDAAIFNLGNNVQNHARISSALRQVSGIAILHDYCYHHFFAHKCFEELRSPPAYARLIHEYYGSDGFNMALRSGVITRDRTLYAPWDGENVADYPLMQPVAALAAAVVVHSRFMEERVAKFFKGPILRLFLPSDQKIAPSPEAAAHRHSEVPVRGRCQFATFGHIGRPKCLEIIVQAMSQSSMLRSRANLVIAGHPGDKEYVREIETMVPKLGLSKQVSFEYSVTNERLLEIKRDTDVFLNLRYPNTEGASGSLVEMLNAGKPVIAYRAGCYADLPESTAVLIDRTSGPDEVMTAMEELLLEPQRRAEVGAAAHDHVREYDSERYVKELKSFILDIQGDLRRRSRLVAPVRDAMTWRMNDVADHDADWFADLTRARRSLMLLERDSASRSPGIFLDWPMEDLIAFVSRVLLHASVRDGTSQLLVDYAQRLGRWQFYLLISAIHRRQALCQQEEVSKEDLARFATRVADPAFWDVAARLRPEIFVRLLYLGVLGRAWNAGEPENWVKRIRQGLVPSAVLLEFLKSVEYRQTFPDGLMNRVEDWARSVGVRSTVRRAVRAQIVWPTEWTLHFNEDSEETEALLGQLWHPHDAQGCWSDGRAGDLVFLLPEDAAEEGATLTLRLRVAGTKVTGQRKITAQCDQLEIASVTIRDDAPLNWSIPLPVSIQAKDGIKLMLTADKDFSPASAGQSKDRRSLGIMLIEGRLALGTEKAEPKVPDFDREVAPADNPLLS